MFFQGWDIPTHVLALLKSHVLICCKGSEKVSSYECRPLGKPGMSCNDDVHVNLGRAAALLAGSAFCAFAGQYATIIHYLLPAVLGFLIGG